MHCTNGGDHLPCLSLKVRPGNCCYCSLRVAAAAAGGTRKIRNLRLFLDNGIACATSLEEKKERKKERRNASEEKKNGRNERSSRLSLDLWVREAREEAMEEEKTTKGRS